MYFLAGMLYLTVGLRKLAYGVRKRILEATRKILIVTWDQSGPITSLVLHLGRIFTTIVARIAKDKKPHCRRLQERPAKR